MRYRTASFISYLIIAVYLFGLTGCTIIFRKDKIRKGPNQQLLSQISELESELSELERAKQELESRLSQEIDDEEVQVQLTDDRGLVITFVAEVLFDSGKAELRSDSLSKLDKVARVLITTVSDLNVGIEGHTDNIPIRHSGWKSNWELSSARAMSVLHFMIDNHSVRPDRLSATGYGEYQPVASNDSSGGRQQNRRVEIVILPKAEKQSGVVPGRNL